MAFDFKKEYKEFYNPSNKPGLVDVPEMNYIAVYGSGDPNEEGGEYKASVEALYAVAYTLKMSKKTDYCIDGYFDYVVPPLEGFWEIAGMSGMDYGRKDEFKFISVIRLPDFVSEKDVLWAVAEAGRKKKKDFSCVKFVTINEGLCVQCMHTGAFDDEPQTVGMMDRFLEDIGYENDFSSTRLHHEIYLSDPRKTAPEKLRTVIRHPVKKK